VKRLIPLIGGLCVLLLFSLMTAAAQQPPPATLPPIPSPTFDPTFAATEEAAPEATAAPDQPSDTALSAADTEALPHLLSARVDLELLAGQLFDPVTRPNGWNGSVDVSNPQLSLLIRYDLEVLAANRFGADTRPAGWFGGVVSVPLAFARDIRHDLELFADDVMGTSTVRPAGWQGDDPLMRCDRATQALITVLQKEGYGFNIDFGQADFCASLHIEMAQFVEREILQPPPAPVTVSEIEAFNANQPFRAENYYVVAFYDRHARRRAGVIPEGTGFTPISRSGFGFSNMMIVEGNGFRIFVDYLTTPVTTEQFNALPEIGEGTVLTTCNAAWCE
jgi:hypothetical protein